MALSHYFLNKKNSKYTFNWEFNYEHTCKFFDTDVIILTSSVNRTQSICVLFFPPLI